MSTVLPLRSRLLGEAGFRHGFSPRAGGVSAPPYATCNLGRSVGDNPEHVAENQRRFASALGYAPDALFEVSQVHGREVVRVDSGAEIRAVRTQPADGLVAGAGPVVGVRTADCVPVLLADPLTRSVAALHAGWRGTALGVVPAGVLNLAELAGAPPSRLIAAVFPHIGPCCFEVSDEVAQTLADATPQLSAAGVSSDSAVVQRRLGGKPHVDLGAIVRRQLLAAGLVGANIDLISGCTRCDAARFFSFRRDGQASGRHLTAIIAS